MAAAGEGKTVRELATPSARLQLVRCDPRHGERRFRPVDHFRLELALGRHPGAALRGTFPDCWPARVSPRPVARGM